METFIASQFSNNFAKGYLLFSRLGAKTTLCNFVLLQSYPLIIASKESRIQVKEVTYFISPHYIWPSSKCALFALFLSRKNLFLFSEIKFEALSKLIASNQVIVMDVRNYSELQDTGILPRSHSVPRKFQIQRI